jgi:ribosome-binding factor A
MSRRTDRISDLIRAELADIIRRDLSDPRLKLVTVSSVNVSPDLGHARILISSLGNEPERQAAVTALQHASAFVRRQLGRRLKLRATPELVFTLDHGAEYSQQISDLLEGLHRDDQST